MTITHCEYCHSKTLRRSQSDSGEYAIAVCHDCRTVYNLHWSPTETGVISVSANDAIREFRGYDTSIFVGSIYNRLLKKYTLSAGAALDIGCFDGVFPAFLRSRGFDAYGLELQPMMAEFCRQQGVAVYAGSIPRDLPNEITCRTYSLITSLESVYYWDDLDACAATIAGLSASGGLILLKFLQGTSTYFSNVASYYERAHDFRALPNVDAFCNLMERHRLVFVNALPFTYLYDRRRYHPNPLIRQWHRSRLIAMAASMRLFGRSRDWDKAVVLFRKP